jgi:hypothetical protein
MPAVVSAGMAVISASATCHGSENTHMLSLKRPSARAHPSVMVERHLVVLREPLELLLENVSGGVLGTRRVRVVLVAALGMGPILALGQAGRGASSLRSADYELARRAAKYAIVAAVMVRCLLFLFR